jgi:hypothetical protein
MKEAMLQILLSSRIVLALIRELNALGLGFFNPKKFGSGFDSTTDKEGN